MNVVFVERTIRDLMRSHNTPGVAISVVKNNKMLYSKGFGSRNLKNFQPMDSDTLIGIGSITKSFTAFAIVKLQEQGKLSLEDSVNEYLRVEPFVSHPAIKIKHLLSHSSGIPSLDAGMLGLTYTYDDFSRVYPVCGRDDFFAHLADAEEFIRFEPGEKFFYNNDLYSCLGFIIEEVGGLPFDESIKQTILDPLEMSRTVFTQQELYSDPQRNIMTGYLLSHNNDRAELKESEVPIGGFLQAPGGLYTSMNELSNYAKCLLNKGEYNGRQILNPESVAALFEGQIITTYGESDFPQYALGWSMDEPSSNLPYKTIHHGGRLGTSQSFLILVPDLNLGIAVAENSSTDTPRLIAYSILSALQNQIPEAVVEDLRIRAVINEIQGLYKSPYNMYELKVELKSGILQAYLQLDDGGLNFPLIIKELDKLVFSTYSLRSSNKDTLEFYRNDVTGNVEFAAYDRFLYRRV